MSQLSFQTPSPFTSYQTRDGGKFTSDANGLISGLGLSGPIIADLLAAGAVPVLAPISAPAYRNLLDGGDFTTNPWQRNIAGLATTNSNTTAIAATATYFPDRWFAAGGASSAIQLTKVADVTVPGFTSSCLFSRKAANADTAALNFGQVVPMADVAKLQNQTVTLSFWARKAADYSGGALTVALPYGTGNAANCTAANMLSGSWTDDGDALTSAQALTTSMKRYSFSCVVPYNATELGVQLTWTPTGTAGTVDGIYLNGFQLEQGGLTSFQFRDSMTDLERSLRYAWAIAEPADGVSVGICGSTSTSAQKYSAVPPVIMVKAPTVTVAAGSFKASNNGGTPGAATGLTGATSLPSAVNLTATATLTAGAVVLTGGGGSGYILASADF